MDFWGMVAVFIAVIAVGLAEGAFNRTLGVKRTAPAKNRLLIADVFSTALHIGCFVLVYKAFGWTFL